MQQPHSCTGGQDARRPPTRILLLLLPPLCTCHRVEVFHRLYQQAITLRQKMETRRELIKQSEMQVG